MTTSVFGTALLHLLIATGHGMLGAWLAVRMVFRPRRAWKLFGWRIPFTPGMIPAERSAFLKRFASVIAERVLTVETIADEIMALGIEGEVGAASMRHYAEQTTSDDFLHHLARRIVELLADERNAAGIGRRLTDGFANVVIEEVGATYGLVGRLIAHRLVELGMLKRIVTLALEDIAALLSRNEPARAAMVEAITTVGGDIFEPESTPPRLPSPNVTPVTEFVQSLGRRLNIELLLRNQLEQLTDQMIEDLIYRAAGRELQMIVRFGALVGLLVGIVQAGLFLLTEA
ncbi:MAG: DUF445 family protein [Chloracidobacterium sp.]|uniref:DUF445 family protein n=1 Tax=Chloracidobacterium validum TaxID=2821543 RepID=A0ABX8B5W6_9BACT|nr:DUF445 family protein [Chloracidobacterium validum]QUW02366.1 DUF445 family protein [Chloracidobacterium validum]